MCQHHKARTQLWREWPAGLLDPGEGTVPTRHVAQRGEVCAHVGRGRRAAVLSLAGLGCRPDSHVIWMPSASWEMCESDHLGDSGEKSDRVLGSVRF